MYLKLLGMQEAFSTPPGQATNGSVAAVLLTEDLQNLYKLCNRLWWPFLDHSRTWTGANQTVPVPFRLFTNPLLPPGNGHLPRHRKFHERVH